jgi:hypothetical protein
LKIRNDIYFQGAQWKKMEKLYERYAGMIRNWNLVNKEADVEKLKTWAEQLEARSSKQPRIAWDVMPQLVAVIASDPGPFFSSSVHVDSVPVPVNAKSSVDNESCNRN